MTVEAPRSVVCGSCGSIFGLSARNVRAARQRGEEPICRLCRHSEKPPDEREQARLRKWWTDRYSMDELLELGRGWAIPEVGTRVGTARSTRTIPVTAGRTAGDAKIPA